MCGQVATALLRGVSRAARPQGWVAASATWLVAATLLLSAIGSGAAAQAATPDPHFAQGLSALQSGHATLAISEFRASLAVTPRAATWLNLGLAYGKLNWIQQAATAFTRYLQLADPALDARNIAAVRGELDRLRRASTVLVIAVHPRPTRITVDGQTVDVDGQQLWLAPGPHSLTLERPGFRTHQQSTELPAGRFEFALTMTALPQDLPSGRDGLPDLAPPPGPRQDALQGPSTQPTATAPAQARPTETRTGDSGPPCLLGQTCVGILATGGAPNAVGAGLWFRLGDYIAAGIDVQFLPKVKVDLATVNARLITAGLHVHPFGNALFASVGLGVQHVFAAVDHPIARVTADWNIPVLGLGLGVTSRSGVTFGIDAAILVELQDSTLRLQDFDFDLEPTVKDQLEQEANKAVDSVRDVLPFMFQVNVLRIGYQF